MSVCGCVVPDGVLTAAPYRAHPGPEDRHSEEGRPAVLHADVHGLPALLHLPHEVQLWLKLPGCAILPPADSTLPCLLVVHVLGVLATPPRSHLGQENVVCVPLLAKNSARF